MLTVCQLKLYEFVHNDHSIMGFVYGPCKAEINSVAQTAVYQLIPPSACISPANPRLPSPVTYVVRR